MKNNLLIFFNHKKNVSLALPVNNLRLTFVFLKLTSFFYQTQSLEFFAYQQRKLAQLTTCSVLYLTHLSRNLNLFSLWTPNHFYSSCEDLFFNFWWMEREVFELTGVLFFFKTDTRNLLLEFGNFYKPLLKQFPVYGFVDFFYSPLINNLRQFPISIQL